ncbi:CvpA family protein [Anaerovorax odorimutans]|uniref:CvpA family protein n=1 Tax=Anaerovorax odorimutans TaxID=109327 RepID=A0ABT1RN55_9FIRM|nr:CvpA family protein [Anaerovorax odorimutans]MCQ4636612.1 CvpA family protein [Anaerovorax odorimutans]
MFLDIIVAVILILTMVSGFRKGFIYTFTHTLGWLGAMVAAFIFSSPLRQLASERTQIDEQIYRAFYDKLSLSSDSLSASTDTFPLILGKGIDTAATEAADAIAARLTELTMTVLCFLAILLAVKVILFFLTIALSKRQNKGFTGFLDGLLGLVAGMIRGIIFVFIFLALLLPVVNLVSPASTQLILDSLDASYFSRTLYDSNFIVLVIGDLLA